MNRRDRNNQRNCDEAPDEGRNPGGAEDSGLRRRFEGGEPVLSPDGAGSKEHRVGRSEIVVAAASGQESKQRDHVHPADHAEGLALRCCEEKPEASAP
jgi:hypothetical protein